MITNKIRIEFVGHVGYYDIHLLAAKGLKRLFATNTDDGSVECPANLIEKADLGATDYNICVDIFQHIWMSPGSDDEFTLGDIKWKHLGMIPDEITVKTFINRFGINDVFELNDGDPKTKFENRAKVKALFITKFNLNDTGFLADMENADNE